MGEILVPLLVPDKDSTSGEKLIMVPWNPKNQLSSEDKDVLLKNFWDLLS
jgi:hypothetical protein